LFALPISWYEDSLFFAYGVLAFETRSFPVHLEATVEAMKTELGYFQFCVQTALLTVAHHFSMSRIRPQENLLAETRRKADCTRAVY
jgi:hypothetical protein